MFGVFLSETGHMDSICGLFRAHVAPDVQLFTMSISSIEFNANSAEKIAKVFGGLLSSHRKGYLGSWE